MRLATEILGVCGVGAVLLLSASACDTTNEATDMMPMSTADMTPPFTGSGLGPDEIPLVIDQHCPGDPDCLPGGDDKLLVGYGKRIITPEVEGFIDANKNERWDAAESFVDANNNKMYDMGEDYSDINDNKMWDAAETYTDTNKNGKYDPVWIAGFGNGRVAYDIHDDTYVRCFALRQNKTTVVTCVVDSVGYFSNEQVKIRAALDKSLEVDLLMMSASHVHETQDTIGIWGPTETITGLDPVYMTRIRKLSVEAITDAVNSLKPAKMSIAMIKTVEDNGSAQRYISDTRYPSVIDTRMNVIQFDAAADDKPIVTVINWAAHPESVGSDNHSISSDFVHWMRQEVEKGTGSDLVHIQSSLGGQIGPGRILPIDQNGKQLSRKDWGFAMAEAWGIELGGLALKAFAKRKPAPDPKLEFWHTSFRPHIENLFYHTAFFIGAFDRDFIGYDQNLPLIRTDEYDNAPVVNSEAAYLKLGPMSAITCPGELFPENFLGGYDGSEAYGFQFIDMMEANYPEIPLAPKAPYLIDMMGGEHDHRMLWGATLDFLGYILPKFVFKLHPAAPYLEEAEGDHYEETNSIGPRAEEIVGTMRQLVMAAEGK